MRRHESLEENVLNLSSSSALFYALFYWCYVPTSGLFGRPRQLDRRARNSVL
jgi:hypothetical protein